jgi:apolipoprotein D and lipocalin family protein
VRLPTRDTMKPLAAAIAAAALLVAAVAFAAEPAASALQPPRVEPVAAVDLARYAGLWYEVARFPNRFQDTCSCCVTATYVPRPDGRLTVVNECRTRDGAVTRAEGEARKAAVDGPASRLKVRFAPGFLSFLPFVWGDYWILDLADDYSHALVGSPDRSYLWILSRQPSLPDATYARIVEQARRQGFDTGRLVRTPQREPGAPVAR